MARSSYEIRRLDAGEVRAVIDPFLLCSAREEGFDLGDRLERAVAELMLGIELGSTHLFGAYDNRGDCFDEEWFRLIGIFQIDEGADVHLGDYYFFRRLYVRPEWRNKGVAHALLSHGVVRTLQDPGRVVLAQVNHRLPRLYRRLGFASRFTVYAAGVMDIAEHASLSLPGVLPAARRAWKEREVTHGSSSDPGRSGSGRSLSVGTGGAAAAEGAEAAAGIGPRAA